MDRGEVLARLKAGRDELEQLLAQVDREWYSRPQLSNGWSVKDLIGHLGFWEGRIVNLYHTLVQGGVPDPKLEGLSTDELNRRAYEVNSGRPLTEVVESERRAYASLLELAETATDAELFDPGRFAWTEGQPFVNWIVGNSYGHYAEHLGDVRAWIEAMTESETA